MTTSDKLREIAEQLEQRKREFVDEWGVQVEYDRDMIHAVGKYDKLYSDLTALLSENYYPKEFLLWTHSQDYWKFDMVKCVWIPDEPVAFQYEITTDELFNYWKENEQ